MPTYVDADKELGPLVKAAMKQYRPDLHEAGATVDCLFAVGALKHHGYPAAAIIKINSQEQRARGCSDLTLIVNQYTWEEKLAEDGQQSLLHHELLHPELVRHTRGAMAGTVKTDDCHRPKMRMRLHDFEVGGFIEIAERWGADALEVQALRHVVDRWGQILFPWMEHAGVA